LSQNQAGPAILSRSCEPTTAQPIPSVKPIPAPPCLADSRWSPLDEIGCIPLGILVMLAALALLSSEDATAMEGARAGLATTALRRDPSAPLRMQRTSAAQLWRAHGPAPPEHLRWRAAASDSSLAGWCMRQQKLMSDGWRPPA